MENEKALFFAVKDCALITIATGRKAVNLAELRDNLQLVNTASIYHHFWGGLLVPRFEEREFHNDFAGWVRHSLREPELAERLAAIDPGEAENVEAIRQELLEIIEECLEQSENAHWMPAARQFEFLRGQLVVFDTHRRLEKPADLAEQIPKMSTSSIFYHFIDARSRMPESSDDFRFWLTGYGAEYQDLCAKLAAIDPFFSSLSQIRQELAELFSAYFAGGVA
ncbi:MAG: hypothetical protein KKE82_10875 [Proteobacteria bacterium]|nr:hypothetical protein [Pseudomonadota bacterium]MBU1547260.1 hypothetical protein [Pseudomonadota bacterium]